MFTPQQIEQISFSKAKFGGYDMEQVDEVLEPLTEDYVTLFKENAMLKSKMRVLISKLEEYRKGTSAAADTSAAKQTADKIIADAEAKAAQILKQAKAAAAAVPAAAPAANAGPSTDALVAIEKARVSEARKAAAARITEIQSQMQSCIQALDRIKNANVAPAAAPAAAPAPKAADVYDSDAVADEISQNLEAMVGTTQDTAPKAAPAHPTQDTTSRFTNLNLQFGRNYDPTHK